MKDAELLRPRQGRLTGRTKWTDGTTSSREVKREKRETARKVKRGTGAAGSSSERHHRVALLPSCARMHRYARVPGLARRLRRQLRHVGDDEGGHEDHQNREGPAGARQHEVSAPERRKTEKGRKMSREEEDEQNGRKRSRKGGRGAERRNASRREEDEQKAGR